MDNANRTYYSGPDGIIHQAFPAAGGLAAFSYAGSGATADFSNAASGEIDVSPQAIAIDATDERSDYEVVKIDGWNFQTPASKLYGYVAELEKQATWNSWVTDQQARQKAAAAKVGDSLKGTQF